MEGLRVTICTPTRDRPSDAYLQALERSVPALDAAGFTHSVVFEVGCPYISGARATMLRKALAWDAEAVVFIDDDMSWRPNDLVRLIQAEGEVVGGTYRYRKEEVQYMGNISTDESLRPVCREDGCMKAYRLPAGFLKITKPGVERFMGAYPELIISNGEGVRSPDLFNHGAIKGTWFGEDMAFSMRWLDAGGEMWLLPDLELNHHGKDGRVFEGNFHKFMLQQPGGSEA